MESETVKFLEDQPTDTQLKWEITGNRLRLDVPGSNSWKDVLTFMGAGTARTKHGKIHAGIWEVAKIIFDKLRIDMVKDGFDDKKLNGVFITGHSLGGGIGLALAYLIRTKLPNIVNIECENVGGPKVVDSKMKRFLEERGKYTYKVNGNDPIPLFFSWYKHVGKAIILKKRTFPFFDFNLISGDHVGYW